MLCVGGDCGRVVIIPLTTRRRTEKALWSGSQAARLAGRETGIQSVSQLTADNFTNIAMGRIIHCSDLILRIPESQEVGNLTEWLYESTDFRPIKPETCEIRDELDNHQKILVIVMIWTFLVFLSIFYCYFCEQKLFPTQMLFSTCLVDRAGFLQDGRCPILF